MAGEAQGKFYEALTYVLIADSKILGGSQLYWDKPVAGLSKRPDLVIGASLDHIDAVIMVTHSGSAKESEKKYWRNACEYVESKLFLGGNPFVLNLVYNAAMKPNIKVVSKYSFDASIIVEDEAFGPTLLTWAGTAMDSIPHDGDTIQYVRDRLQCDLGANPKLATAVSDLRQMLIDALRNAKSLKAPLISTRTRKALSADKEARKTALRRGIAKAILVGDIDAIWQPANTQSTFAAPDYCKTLNFHKPSILGDVVCDQDLMWLRENLSRESVKEIISNCPIKQMQVWVEPLKNLAILDQSQAYAAQHWDELTTPEGLYHHLVKTSSREYIKSHFENRFIPPGWLFDYLRELYKSHKKRKTAWGWAALVKDLKLVDKDSAYRSFVSEVTGIPIEELSNDWSGFRTVTYALPEWIMGDSRANFKLRPTDLPRLAYTFAPRLASVPKAALEELKQRILGFYIANYLEAKLIQYRNFDPLRILIELELSKAGLPYEFVERFPSAFVEKATAAGERFNVRTGATSVLRCNDMLICWRSVTGLGRDHKQKELIARAFAIGHTWGDGGFRARSKVKRLILVLDGDVDEPDIKALSRGGWDEIFYPNELDSLPISINM
ncbi:hypothetical protein SAMN05444166_7301 [Singulisphaera sp. GP187]|uniref:hypothetical protein n=1 Tax=Singulisphaera sp. GP187 TaxID=1882752 RepID=UPI00092BC841|nr:hypothetical protein [Singulisphaera sp. GP187]SIO63287.1 hypothetical protein SAMN05444166_7301 [Singulisphaera sp. GP187]